MDSPEYFKVLRLVHDAKQYMLENGRGDARLTAYLSGGPEYYSPGVMCIAG